MCSICRNPKCTYRFGGKPWKIEDDEVVIPLPPSDLTLLEQVRAIEGMNRIHRLVKETLALPKHSENCMCRECTGEYH